MSQSPAVTRRTLGNTGLTVPIISLGTVKLGRNQGVKYPSAFKLPDDASVINLLQCAYDLGINLIDTAPAYGTSESRLGELLPSLSGTREDWLICSKAGETFEGGHSYYDFSAAAIQRSVETSLRRLRTDYLDMVLIHSDGSDVEILEKTDAVETLQKMRDAGLIRTIGMSTKTVEGGLKALPACDLLMVTLNLEDDSQLSVIKSAQEQQKGILLKKVFASGHAEPAASLRFALSVTGVHSAVIGTLSPEHLADNVSSIKGL